MTGNQGFQALRGGACSSARTASTSASTCGPSSPSTSRQEDLCAAIGVFVRTADCSPKRPRTTSGLARRIADAAARQAARDGVALLEQHAHQLEALRRLERLRAGAFVEHDLARRGRQLS